MVVGMKTTLNLDDELMREVREEAAARGTTMTSIVEDALRDRLRHAGTEKYVWRPVVVRGTRPPDIDPADRAALYELLDDDLR